MYIILIMFLLMIFMFSLLFFKFELLSPPVLVSLMFLFSAVFGLLCYKTANYADFRGATVLYTILGVVSFIIGSTLPYAYFSAKEKKGGGKKLIRRKRIEIKGEYMILILLFDIISLIIFYRYMRGTVVEFGYTNSSLAMTISNYRLVTQILAKTHTPVMISLLERFVELFGICALFAFCHNVCFKCLKKRDFKFFILVSFWAIMYLLNSNRGGLLLIMAVFIYLLYYFYNMYYGWSMKTERMILKIGITALSIFIVFFVLLAVILKRYQSLGDMNIIVYLSSYISFGLRNFDLYILNPAAEGSFGQELFYSLYKSINNLLNNDIEIVRHLEFRTVNGLSTGNIYTSFRRFYATGGGIGIAFLSFTQGFIFTWLYMKNKISAYKGKITFGMLIFAYFANSMFYMPIDDIFYSSVISVGILPRLIIIYIIYSILISKKIKIVYKR